ncbi:hypothetical protein M2152_002133 [Microbacteriaceae bacterium SG_E_30_P1]|uniref:Gram-positive cocci surface proteins LPxTG domain-containing protein n=1 Tax=Antiquaquibacter oligotrophicus TaxID=2880260 RepID=A0ABT6KPM8_9MICO|nr:hypothetical protein [Antiquaquibacter oligotrophicus]MDH6181951.1 hypothetical protein [Antiquaquibacter oligotrophicus]UDF12379.1 hypothetical protein LH407_09425 [Antiquaquibacter oligotrophicus]
MKRSIVIAGTAVAAAASLALLPAAATAHTDHLFTWSYSPVGSDAGGFSTASKTDAALALLGENTLPIIDEVSGMEVCDEVGYAVGFVEENSEVDFPAVATWDHSTGAILSGPVLLDLQTEVMSYVDDVVELDTLADCTVISIVHVYGGDEPGASFWGIAEIDPATGDTTVVLELPDYEVVEWSEFTGLATNAAGATHIFFDLDGLPYYAAVDFEAGTLSDPVALQGLSDYFESSGFTQGVDFDAAGGLWLVTGVNAEEEYHLVSYAAGADLGTAIVTDIGILPYYGDGLQISSPIPLTAEGAAVAPVTPAKPQLAATGSELPFGIAAGAIALLLAGGTALVLRRRAA